MELWGTGELLASRDVTANAPTLSLQMPDGETYRAGTPVPVTWTAGDLDGDALTFAISLSSDNGETWLPLALDVTGDGFELSTDDLPAGDAYRVKVRASDGINTTEAISARSFTLHAVVYLPLIR